MDFKLILKLYKQSTDTCIARYGDMDGPVPWSFEEEYAKVIIKECQNIISSAESRYERKLSAEENIMLINQYFDIEE